MYGQPSTPDFRWLASLPFRDSLELGADETAPGMARDRLKRLLGKWSLPEFEDAVTLIASELVTNSQVETGKVAWAGRRPPVRVSLRGGPSAVALLIWDAITAAPVPRDAGDDDESGRGLGIVESLSKEWGYYFPAEFGGKVTWSIIDAPWPA